jgi:hypothetical protein
LFLEFPIPPKPSSISSLDMALTWAIGGGMEQEGANGGVDLRLHSNESCPTWPPVSS